MDETLPQRYNLIRKLGEGAFGTTYLVQDANLDRAVALKISGLSKDPSSIMRLRKEAAALASLNNANIAQYYDTGEMDDGSVFVVTEYIDGSSLQEMVSQGKQFTSQEVIDIALGVANALGAAHNKGIMHGDVKPANILIQNTPDSIRPDHIKLIDFGVISKLNASTGLTQAGSIIGTPLYMAPEQAMGSQLSAATDVYGLGMIMYFALYGKNPYAEESLPSLLHKITTQEGLSFPANIPQNLLHFIQTCLQKKPEARYANGKKAYEELLSLRERIVHESPPLIPQPAATAPPQKLQARSQIKVTAPRPATASKSWMPVAVTVTLALALLSGIFLAYSKGLFGYLIILLGIAIGGLGIVIGLNLRRYLAKKKTSIQDNASAVLAGAKRKTNLSETLAIEVNLLLESVKSIDQRLLAATVAIMLNDYQDSTNASDKRDALLKTVQLLEKLIDRMTPWYVKYEKLLAFFVTAIGLVSGVVTAIGGIQKLI